MTNWPERLTPELREVLGMPNFRASPIAHAFRAAGHEIARKAEDEQAFVLHWLAGLVLKHGTDWKRHAADELDAVAAETRRRADEPQPRENNHS